MSHLIAGAGVEGKDYSLRSAPAPHNIVNAIFMLLVTLAELWFCPQMHFTVAYD